MAVNWINIADAVLNHEANGSAPQGEFLELATVGRSQAPKNLKDMRKMGILAPADDRPPAFGPALGYVLGLSVGSESLRATLVDANGVVRIDHQAPAKVQRLRADPEEVLDDVATAARAVLEKAFEDDALLLGRRVKRKLQPTLPLIGVATGWPSALDRRTKMPLGRGLTTRWLEGDLSVPQRFAAALGLDVSRSHALKAANAVALGAAFDESREPADDGVVHGHTALTIRIGGGLSAGTMVVERQRKLPLTDTRARTESGFCSSSLIEGVGGLAGNIGHLPVTAEMLADCDSDSPEELARLDPSWTCSCGNHMHLEAFASALALVRRVRATEKLGFTGMRWPKDDEWEHGSIMYGVTRLLDSPLVQHALFTIGRLIGRSLLSAIATLDPKTLTIAGPIARPDVKRGIEHEIGALRRPGDDSSIDVRLLEGDANTYAVPRGAALAVFREKVYRNIDPLMRDATLREELVLPLTRADVGKIER